MKPLITVISALLLSFSGMAQSQKTAVVDIDEIMSSMEDYQKAQDQLDQIAESWRQEIAQEMDKVKSMYNKYQAEQVLLSDEMKREREDEIMEKEKEVREMQRRKFGAEGELFNKRQELVAPIQNEVYKAISSYAESRGYDLILDRSSNAGIIYLNDALDKTEDIKKILIR
ncbi:MAG: OmpH family outer membrane protein [Bacteroidetes bacterium]|jgi:outer membrane protein|nr:OmpH family outer membrane protein [Bacteroidota bacterium]